MSAPPRGAARVLAGVALAVTACAVFATMDTASKVLLTVGTPLLVILWGRFLFQALATTVFVLPMRGARGLRTRKALFHVLRGVLLVTGSLFLFASLRFMPVAEMTSIMMIAPLAITLMAGMLLREPVSPLRWLLVAGGFAGTLVIIRPGSEAFTLAMLLPLGQVLCNTGFQVLTSQLARTEDPLTMHLYGGWTGTVLVTPLLPLAWTALAPWQWGVLVLMGVLGAAGHLLLILAYRRAPAMTLTPFLYSQIAFAMLAGWLAFAHVPDGWSALGMAMIVACGLASAWLTVREQRKD